MKARQNIAADFLQPGTAIVRYGYLSDFSTDGLFFILNHAEKKRAEKFFLKSDRVQFTACRAILKLLLSPLLNSEVGNIELVYSPNGKPMLPGMHTIQFNVSHCRDVMMWGISNGNPIGVDVEHLERQVPEGTMGSVCSERELEQIQNGPANLRHEYLINCWTRKEALIKAAGTLSCPPQALDVSLENEEPEVLSTPGSTTEKHNWHLHSLDLPGNYRGAVAIKGKVSHLQIERLNGEWIDDRLKALLQPHSYSSIQSVC